MLYIKSNLKTNDVFQTTSVKELTAIVSCIGCCGPNNCLVYCMPMYCILYIV